MVTRSTRFAVEILGEELGIVEPIDLTPEVTSWPPFYRANWRNPSAITVSNSWLTDVVVSKDEQYEERRGLWERPIRDCTVELSGLRKDDSIRLQSFCMRAGSTKQPMPLYPDRIKTYQTSTGTLLNARVQWMRFYRGQRIALVKPDYTAWSSGGEAIYATIDPSGGGFDANQIFLSSVLPESIPRNTLVFPLIDAQEVQQTSGFVITDTLSTFAFKYQEMNGMSTLPPAWNGEIELTTQYAYGYPILSFRPNFAVRYGARIVRPMQKTRSGRSTLIDVDGTRPNLEFSFLVSSGSREASWEVLRFFDSRRGRLRPFFLKPSQDLMNMTAIDANSITFEAVGRMADFAEFYQYVIMTYEDGSIEIRKIDSQTDNTIFFDTSIPDSGNVSKGNFCYFGRFGSDILKQIWRTDNHCQTAFSFKELVREYNA